MRKFAIIALSIVVTACGQSTTEQSAPAKVNLAGVRDPKAADAAIQATIARQKELSAAAEKYGKEDSKKK